MIDIPTLQTDRLVLRGWRESDAPDYERICRDPETMATIGDGTVMPEGRGWHAIAGLVGHWALKAYGQWAITDAGTGALLGRAGLHNPAGWPGLEIGWLVDRERWGEGIATEAAAAARDWAFDVHGATSLISLIRPGNTRSVRVAEKIGAQYAEDLTVNGNQAQCYRITRED